MAKEWRTSIEKPGTTRNEDALVHDADEFVLAMADYAKLCAAAGTWSDIDTDALLKDIYVDRERISDRPPVKL